MRGLQHARYRWHDQLMRRRMGQCEAASDYDPDRLPKTQRRALAVALLGAGWDLEYLERRHRVKLRLRDFDPESMTLPEKRAVCNALAARGESVEQLEAAFGITRKVVR